MPYGWTTLTRLDGGIRALDRLPSALQAENVGDVPSEWLGGSLT
jgi:hypothetical protein